MTLVWQQPWTQRLVMNLCALLWLQTPLTLAAPQSVPSLPDWAEEAQASRELAGKFHKQMVETGSIQLLYDEFFVADFVERYVQERKQESARNKPRPILLVPGLEYQPELLEQASVKDWKRLLAAANNILYYTMSGGLNRLRKPCTKEKSQTRNLLKAFSPFLFSSFSSHTPS